MVITDLVTLSANIAIALTFLIGLIFGIAQIRAVNRERRERLTLETLKNFQTRDFAELLQFATDKNFPENQEQMGALSQNQRVMFIQFAQQMESLGILVAENLIDLDLIDKTLGTFVTSSWKKYNVIFSRMRERDPFLGEYFQWLAERVEERAKNTPRKPFYLSNKR